MGGPNHRAILRSVKIDASHTVFYDILRLYTTMNRLRCACTIGPYRVR